MKLTGGISLENKKESSYIQWTIQRSKTPSKVFIPLQTDWNLSAVPCVSTGARVSIGQKIANPANAHSTALHTSVSGQITGIGFSSHPLLGETQALEVESDGQDSFAAGVGETRPGWEHLEIPELLHCFQENGLIELRLPTQALHVKIMQAQKQRARTLVINACENEPYVSSDYSLMMSRPVEILKGAEVLRRTLRVDRIVFAVSESEREAAELIKSKIFFLRWSHCDVETVPSLYPQAEDSLLLKTLLARKKISGERIIRSSVFNVATAFSVYEAVALQKPLYERTVTMAGECLVEQKNEWMRLGTPLSYAVKTCRGFLRDPQKVVMGGPMKGIAQLTLDVPILGMTQAVLALPKEVARSEEIRACIRCGECVDHCPAEVSPVMITLAAEEDRFDIAQRYGLHACIECGNCAYVCPSKRPMVELIRYALAQEIPE